MQQLYCVFVFYLLPTAANLLSFFRLTMWTLKVIAGPLTAKYSSNLVLSDGIIAKSNFADQYFLNG